MRRRAPRSTQSRSSAASDVYKRQNGVFGYVPSARIVHEGGYEGGGAMLYTPLPGPFQPSVEEVVVAKVHELVQQVKTEQ